MCNHDEAHDETCLGSLPCGAGMTVSPKKKQQAPAPGQPFLWNSTHRVS